MSVRWWLPWHDKVPGLAFSTAAKSVRFPQSGVGNPDAHDDGNANEEEILSTLTQTTPGLRLRPQSRAQPPWPPSSP